MKNSNGTKHYNLNLFDVWDPCTFPFELENLLASRKF
uniref:Uncharacterized protein n=1 Tax=Nelumbo nucifera TaxID=4432 RepID=A0A822XV21_NELNU|nr:TPA_asm: hypothetical protein HUJ06_025650 [Nelumbo nucifera]